MDLEAEPETPKGDAAEQVGWREAGLYAVAMLFGGGIIFFLGRSLGGATHLMYTVIPLGLLAVGYERTWGSRWRLLVAAVVAASLLGLLAEALGEATARQTWAGMLTVAVGLTAAWFMNDAIAHCRERKKNRAG